MDIQYLKGLVHTTRPQRRKRIKEASNAQINDICKCIYHVCNGDVPLNKSQRSYFRRFKKDLKNLGFRRGSLKAKRKRLIQTGGFLPALISVALPIILSLLKDG
jgi:hypothetical protein